MPKVSVLMPLYNTNESHLREAIESVLNQTFTDFEFLLLNDSPDNTRLDAVVAEYKDPRIKYSRNEKNIGITPSRNKLVELAQGEYLAVMDHDDISLPERFAKQVAYLDAHPETGVVGARVQNIGDNAKTSNYPENPRDIKLGLMYGCVIAHSCAMVRKSLLTEHGIRYEEVYSPSEDYALWCRLLKYTEFANLPEVLFRYRMYEGNTSKAQADKMARAATAVQAFARADNPALYQELLLRGRYSTTIRLFGCIPFLKIKGSCYRRTIYLFDFIPLFTYKAVVKMPRC